MLIKYGKNSGMYILGECSQTFRGMSLNIQGMAPYISGNILKQSAECRQTSRGMFQKTRQNLNFDLCHDILLVFYQLLLLNSNKSRENESRLQITDQIFLRKKKISTPLLIINLLSLITVFLNTFYFPIFPFSHVGVNL